MLKFRIDPWGAEYEGALQLPTADVDENPAEVDLAVPPAPTAEEDQQLMRATARKLAESYLARPPLVESRS